MKTGRTQELINALAGSNSTLAQMYNQKKQQEAQITLRNIQREFSKDSTKKLLELKNDPDYESWPEKMDTFLQSTTKKFSSKVLIDDNGIPILDKNGSTQANPYYCSNDYEARQAMNMLNSSYADLQKQMIVMSLERMDSNNRVAIDNLINANTDDPYMSTDEKINQNLDALKSEEAQLSPEEYNAKQMEIWYKAVATDYGAALDDAITKGIAAGKTWNEIIKDPKSKIDEKKLVDRNGKDKTAAAKAKYKNELTKIEKDKELVYDQKVKDMQNQNAIYLDSLLTQIENSGDNHARAYKYIEQGQKYLEETKGTLKLNRTDQTNYAKYFADQLREHKAAEKNDKKAVEEAKVSSFKSLLETESKNAKEKVMNGEITPEEAAQGLHDYANELDPSQSLEDKISYIFDEFLPDCVQNILNDPRFYEANQTWLKIRKEVTDDPTAYNTKYIYGALSDIIVSAGVKDLDPKAFAAQLNKIKSHIFADKFEELSSKYQIKDGQFGENTNYVKKNDYYTQMAAAAEDSDPVYSDENGVLHFASDQDEKAIRNNQDLFAQLVIDSLGENNIYWGDPPESNLLLDKTTKDETAIPTVRIAHYVNVQMNKDGKKTTTQNLQIDTYHLESIRNKKGKVTGYKIVDENGNQLPAADYKQIEKDQKKQAKENTRKQQQQAKDLVNQKAMNVMEIEAPDSAEYQKMLVSKIQVRKGFEAALNKLNHTADDWDNAGKGTRAQWLAAINTEMIKGTKAGKDYMKLLGIKNKEDIQNKDWWKKIVFGE